MQRLEAATAIAGHSACMDRSNGAARRRWSNIHKRKALAAIFIAALLALPIVIVAYPTGAPAGYTGAPASSVDTGGDCTSCHGGTAQTTGVSISGLGSGNTYTPGVVEQ